MIIRNEIWEIDEKERMDIGILLYGLTRSTSVSRIPFTLCMPWSKFKIGQGPDT